MSQTNINKALSAGACIVPTVDATPAERTEYLACRARSIAYQAAELSVALDRLGRFSAGKGARHIVTKLTELEKSIKNAPDGQQLL